MNDQEILGLLTRTKGNTNGRHFVNGKSSTAESDVNCDFEAPTTAVQTTAEALGPGAGAALLFKQGIDWPVVVWIVLVHALALVAPFFFSWQALMVCACLILLTGSVGVCMGYHRCLTHGSFKTYRPVRWLLAFLGGLSGEGSALTWVANHRKHHYFSDKVRRPALAARRRMVEPHAVVHAQFRPSLAQGAGGEVRARYHEGQDDGGDSPSVSALARRARAWFCF